MSKKVTKGYKGRKGVLKGMEKAWEAVAPTLGAVGLNALIEFPGLDPVESDDGKTVLMNLEFKDRHEQMGLQILRKGANRTSEEGGDGTATTSCVVTATVTEAIKAVGKDDSKVREIRERIESGFQEAIAELSKIKHDVHEDDIEQIAKISSLDPEVAKLISETIKIVGVNGEVRVERSSKIGYSKEVVKGAKFDKGFISHYFVTDVEKQECVLENPYIVVVDRKISTNEQVRSIMESISASGNPNVLFIADDVDSLALATLIQNNSTVTIVTPQGQKQGTYNIACVRNPYTASRARDFLMDIAALTGGTMISEQAGMRLDTATVDLCGTAEKVVVTQTHTTIIGGKGGPQLEERIKAIEKSIEETTSEYEKMMLEERLACLTGGIGIIRVGTYTDTEFNAKKLKFDNAINAAQSALQEGIVAGGGVALYHVSTKVKEPIFSEALKAPFNQMLENSGMLRRSWWQKLLGLYSSTEEPENGEIGYNFKTKGRTNMFDAGIIDSFKVTRLVLEAAKERAQSAISYGTVITIEDEDK